ncbi:MAG: N-acetyltransferase [Chloroflexi bacterium]|nr:MAG: N-acetyltransferase [Chloroflexota bacterium]MBL1193098.1 N-acetyltransferase [Chloroflexota bacterium]NOH10391.1 N-acetyltransferase [Chloroflexota bacterium]
MPVRIHPTAEVSPDAKIGEGTSVWHQAHIREGATIGEECIIGKGVYVGADVSIGNRVKIQNYVSVYEGLTIEDGVMVGPHVCFTNDMHPRAINHDGSLKGGDDWEITPTLIRKGVGLGANSTILCGTTVGRWALVGAGSMVTRDVPDYGLVYGNPARLHGFVCSHGGKLGKIGEEGGMVLAKSADCEEIIQIQKMSWDELEN